MSWIDVSVPLGPRTAVWPGDPPVEIERVQDLDRGDEATVTRITMSTHAGTHVDAPSHYLKGGATLDTMPLGVGLGPARVARYEGDVVALRPRRGERLLLRTGRPDAALGIEAARIIAALPLRLVGIDTMSIGDADVHRVLLAAGVWIVESLDLSHAPPGRYDLVCLPLRIAGAAAAPARVALRPRR